MMNTLFPLFADDHHRHDYDMLQEKLWRARVWMRLMNKRRDRPAIPRLIAR